MIQVAHCNFNNGSAILQQNFSSAFTSFPLLNYGKCEISETGLSFLYDETKQGL